MRDKLRNSAAFYNSLSADQKSYIDGLSESYGIDLKNFKTIEQKKLEFQAQIIGQLAANYSKYAGASLAGMESQLDMLYATGGDLAEIKALENAVNAIKTYNRALDDLSKGVSLAGWKPKSSSSGSKGSSSSSGKDWYETQIDNLKKLEEQTKRTNQVLEKSDQDTAQKRIDNLKQVQEKILAAQKQFIAKGKAATSDEVNQLKIMYEELGEDIRGIWSDMSGDLLEQHEYLIWSFDKKTQNARSMEQIADDDAKMVAQYRKMQQEVHQLADYYSERLEKHDFGNA